METKRGKLDIIHKPNEDLGFLKLLVSVIKDAVDAVLNFHKPFRLAENEFGVDPITVLFWWSLKKMEPRKYQKYITLLKLQGQSTYVIEAVVADYDSKRTKLRCRKIGLRTV